MVQPQQNQQTPLDRMRQAETATRCPLERPPGGDERKPRDAETETDDAAGQSVRTETATTGRDSNSSPLRATEGGEGVDAGA